MKPSQVAFGTLLIQLHWFYCRVLSLKNCTNYLGDAICPSKNTCCTISDGHGAFYTGCIPNNPDHPGHGVCCDDIPTTNWKPFLTIFSTGCSAGSRCSSSIGSDNTILYYCEDDTLLESQESRRLKLSNRRRYPRYILTPSSSNVLSSVYGFPVHSKHLYSRHYNSRHVAAYYSNVGSILSMSTVSMERIRSVLFIIHGSGRNADDYMNVGMTVSKLQTKFLADEILVIAPWFLAPQDGPVYIYSQDLKYGNKTTIIFEPMRWDEFQPVQHTWRYGANAVPPSNHLTSFDVMDSFLHHFTTSSRFGRKTYPNVESIIVMGHSAGGQYTHRWALLSDTTGWIGVGSSPHIRVVVANPRSYTYLDARRYINQTIDLPPKQMISKCPTYNQWEWGLDPGGPLVSTYKDRILESYNISTITRRYAHRDVVYLSGSQDVEILKGSCEDDDFQGLFRRERSFHYFQYLLNYFGNTHLSHKRVIVPEVGHDHALMFESDAAIDAIFRKSTEF